MVLEKTLESPLHCKETQPVNPKGSQSWIFIGRTDAEAETPILWPPDVKKWLIKKDPHAGKDWREEEKGMTEDEMVGWHHWLNGHEFEQALGVGDGLGGLACFSSSVHKELDTTERLNWGILTCFDPSLHVRKCTLPSVTFKSGGTNSLLRSQLSARFQKLTFSAASNDLLLLECFFMSTSLTKILPILRNLTCAPVPCEAALSILWGLRALLPFSACRSVYRPQQSFGVCQATLF